MLEKSHSDQNKRKMSKKFKTICKVVLLVESLTTYSQCICDAFARKGVTINSAAEKKMIKNVVH